MVVDAEDPRRGEQPGDGHGRRAVAAADIRDRAARGEDRRHAGHRTDRGRDQLGRQGHPGEGVGTVPVGGGALMPPEAPAGAEGFAERRETLAHRGEHGGRRVDKRSAGAVADGGGDRVGQGERPGRRVVVQVPAGRLGAQPLPHQRRLHADLRRHFGGLTTTVMADEDSGSGQRGPQTAAGAEGGEQHAQRRP